MRALRQRPTTLERWPKGVHPGIVLATREDPRGGDAFFQKRVPKGAPDYVETARIEFPSGPHRRRGLPDRDRGRRRGARRWGRSPSTRGRCAATTSTIPTSCGSTSTRSRAPTSTTRCAWPPTARELLERARLRRLPEDVGRPRHPHLRPHRAALDVHRHAPRRDRLRARARAPAARRGDDEVVEGGARRAHLRRLQPERPRPDDRVGLQHPPEAGRARVGAVRTGTSSATSQPEDFTVATMPARFAERRRPARRDRRRRALAPAAARPLRAAGRRRHALSARLPEDAGRAQARAAVARPRPQEGRATACGSFFVPRAAGRDGGGTTGPMSPSGASSRSTITGAWSLGPLPLRA